MGNYKETFELWKSNPYFDGETRNELSLLTDEKEIEDRFYRDLEFGTGGLRGVLGAGSNRMNKYNVRRATDGFSKYLLEKFGEAACKRGVAIAYDCRNYSKEFARESALVLAANGIHAYLFTILSATPLLSFTVRHLGCCGGIVITASHNPKEYNGYKAYDESGCQLCPDDASQVIELVNSINISSVKVASYEEAVEAGLLTEIGEDVLKAFIDTVSVQAHPLSAEAKAGLVAVYSPLHGTGYEPVRRILESQGYSGVVAVPEQTVPDGNFTTVRSPNPEERDALSLAIKKAESLGADIAFGTDPDSDRIGIAVRESDGGYRLFTGNQTGAVLVNYVLERRRDSLKGSKSALVKTIVTSELGADIAKSYGLTTFDTLTGFKFIGALMNKFEKEGSYDFVVGYEESYGYLVGKHARDKDAVVAAMLICEMAAYYKEKKLSLIDVLEGLYEKFGYYIDTLDSFTLKGKDGQEKIASIMANLRKLDTDLVSVQMVSENSDLKLAQVKDYSLGVDGLPKSDVLKYFFANGSWMAIRPSGTEPKVKVYYSIKCSTQAKSETMLATLKSLMSTIIN